MSNPKITSRNLTYTNSLPPFLQRLHNTATGLSGRHEQAVARPKRSRDAAADAEDEPAYVVEETGDALSREEYEAMTRRVVVSREAVGGEAADEEAAEGAKVGKETVQTPHAVIGTSRKRKAAKVIIGTGDSGDEEERALAGAGNGRGVRPMAMTETKMRDPRDRGTRRPMARQKAEKAGQKVNVKGKKAKLSFSDDDDG